jgi:transposase-like protein
MESNLSIVEPSAETAETATRTAGSRRRRLNQDEEREIARLYGQTSTPTSEIRDKFGIGDSSLYRVVQRQGVPLRGRPASSSPRPTARRAQRGRPRQRIAIAASTTRTPETTSTAEPRVDGRTRLGRERRAALAKAAVAPATGNGRQRFEIRFVAERVVSATDIRDALRQVESFGAIDITGVSRED